MKYLAALVFFSGLIFKANAQEKIGVSDLELLKSYMSGSFSSEVQSQNDSDFYNIHLHMQPIWEQSKDGFWLYVEQAIISSLDKPYRQRIYHVSIVSDSLIRSEVFEMKSPLRFAGAYKDVSKLKNVTIDSLEARTGCAILLRKKDNYFVGSTHKQDCMSTLRGASYASSEVSIFRDKLVSWDRGWDTSGKQMWGAVKSGYEFVKQKN
jgi:hypothetical protein